MPPFSLFSTPPLFLMKKKKILFCLKCCQVCVGVNQPNFQGRLSADRSAGNFQSAVIFSQMTRERTPFISARKLKLSTESKSNSDLCWKLHHVTLHNYLAHVTSESLVVCFAVAMAANVAEI